MVPIHKKKIIIHKILPETDFILIGKWAIILIEHGISNVELKSMEKIQIISSSEIKKTIYFINEKLKSLFNNNLFELIYNENNLYIPNDYRIKRFTVYINYLCEEDKCPVKKMLLMDIFTNATYELIPWISSNRFLKRKNKFFPKNIKIGNPYVLLKFLFLDLWILRIIYSKKILSKDIIIKKINFIWKDINKIRNSKKLNGIINKSFTAENYIGIYKNKIIYFKTLTLEKFIPVYYPYKWKKDKKKYRS